MLDDHLLLFLFLTTSSGPFLGIFMRVAKSGHKIENEIGHSIDLGSFLVFLSLVTMSHEVKNEVGMCLALNLIHYE